MSPARGGDQVVSTYIFLVLGLGVLGMLLDVTGFWLIWVVGFAAVPLVYRLG